MKLEVDNTGKKISLIFATLTAVLVYPLIMFFSGQWEVKPFVKLYSMDQFKNQFSEFSQSTSGTQFVEFMIQNGLDPIGFRYYSLCLFAGLIFGFWLLIKYLNRLGYKMSQIDRLFIELLIFGLFGARLGYVLSHSNYFINKPLEILNLQQGGLSLFGGLILSIIPVIKFTVKNKLNIFSLTDHIVPSGLMVLIFSRLGNFFNYESYGPKTDLPWKMFVPEGAVNNNRYLITDTGLNFYHPAFLYEMLPNIILLLFIAFLFNKLSVIRGFITSIFLIGYGIIRFNVENFRLDSQSINQYMTLGQLFAISFIILGVLVFVVSKKRKSYE